MESPCKIICFGDSITKAWTPLFEKAIKQKYSDHEIDVINAGVVSETTVGACSRVDEIISQEPTVVLVGFGMNDWRKGVSPEQFRENLLLLAGKLKKSADRVLFLTITPDSNDEDKITQTLIDYNEIIKEVAFKERCRVIDLFDAFIEQIQPIETGLYDSIHPDDTGNEVIVEELVDIVPLDRTVIVWSFNGEYCFCNYSCEYCYVTAETNAGHKYIGKPEEWCKALKNTFGDEKLTLYFSFGEPMASRGFYEVLDMVASEHRWKAHITSNVALPLDRLLSHVLVKEGRLEINASFHPSMVSLDDFLKQLFLIRQAGIEPSIVYVMYPPQMDDFKGYFDCFHSHNFFVHVRRFRGWYDNRFYPEAYTEGEKQFIARYCDKTTIKYMLYDNEELAESMPQKQCYAGMYYLMLDHEGDLWLSPDYKGARSLGNILHEQVALSARMKPYGGKMMGSVNILASMKEANLQPLDNNFTWHFAAQSGVFRDNNNVVQYPYMHDSFLQDIR